MHGKTKSRGSVRVPLGAFRNFYHPSCSTFRLLPRQTTIKHPVREKEKAFTLLLLVWSVAREGGQSSCNGAGGAECWVGKQFRRCAERIHYSQAKTHLHVQTSSHIIRTIFLHVLSLVFHLVCSGRKRAMCEGKSQQPFFSETPQTCTSFHFLLCTSSVFHLHLTTPPPITHHETSSVFSPPPK